MKPLIFLNFLMLNFWLQLTFQNLNKSLARNLKRTLFLQMVIVYLTIQKFVIMVF